MKTLLMLGTLGQEHISFERELPSFAEAFVLKKQTSLEQLVGMKVEREIEEDLMFGVDQYEFRLMKKGNYELFLFGRSRENSPYCSFEHYPAIGIAFRIEF